jgi:hypothetical protein
MGDSCYLSDFPDYLDQVYLMCLRIDAIFSFHSILLWDFTIVEDKAKDKIDSGCFSLLSTYHFVHPLTKFLICSDCE